MADIKKILLSKKIDGVVYNVYPKTSADVVEYSKVSGEETVTTTVAEELAAIATSLSAVDTSTAVDDKIAAANTALYNQIMGITDEDGTSVQEAYDTLKEVAQYLTDHGDVVAGFTADINALKLAVGDAESGLIKDVADLKTTTSTNATNIQANADAIAANTAAIATKGVITTGTEAPAELGDNELYLQIIG